MPGKHLEKNKKRYKFQHLSIVCVSLSLSHSAHLFSFSPKKIKRNWLQAICKFFTEFFWSHFPKYKQTSKQTTGRIRRMNN